MEQPAYNMLDAERALHEVDLGIVVVSYNVRDLLRNCLRSIDASLAGSSITYRTVVVDNASGDRSAEMVQAEFAHVLVVANTMNRGFAGGTNDGLRALGLFDAGVSRQRPPRLVLLLNPDTEIERDALPRLVGYVDTNREVVAVGPQLRYGDGAPQSSRRRFPSIPMLVLESTLLEQWWPGNRWARRYRMEDRADEEEQRVDWLVGAALLVRTEAAERAGPLDESFFMYSEELEWQDRIARTSPPDGAAIVYLPDAVITHHEGKSSEQQLARRHINFNRSKVRYARLRFGRSVALALRAFLLLTFILQVLIEVAKWLVGHKRSLRASRVRHYLQVVRSGL